jgi:iron complex outermembrane recepter protein
MTLRESQSQGRAKASHLKSGLIAGLSAWLMQGIGLAASPHNYTDLSLEELMDVPVTSVSKKTSTVGESAAAVAVITPEDIRRLGITSIPEALRLVPGINVARVTANKWAITARGFNGEYASKLLVLVDGRSVYSPNFAGVYWEEQDLMLEDLARIEVIRGPGATLWGANAVNGVINVITTSARDARAGLLSAAVGTEEQPSGGLRYAGGTEDVSYRVYARYFDRDGFVDSGGQDTGDDWRSVRGGFRLDWQRGRTDVLTLQGDIYASDVGQYWTNGLLETSSNVDFQIMREHRGGNLLGRWTREHASGSSSSLQIYYDRLRHIDTGTVELRDTGDFDWQHRFKPSMRQEVTWGAGYRISSDDLAPLTYAFYVPRSRTTSLYSAFVQDEFSFAADRVRLTLGAKIEHNDYTGFETQPSARVLWTLGDGAALWASVARAVRTPARFDRDARVDAVLFDPETLLAFVGNRDVESEEMLAYEVGYRRQVTPALSVDITTFYNVYDHILNYDEAEPFFEEEPAPGHWVIPLRARNSGHGTAWGAEVSMQWTPVDRWKLAAGYSLLRMDVEPESVYVSPGDSPRNQAHLRSYLNVARHVELNGAAYYVDHLPRQSIPAFVRLDLGAVWRPMSALELGLWGQNLLDRRHGEFTSLSTAIRTEIPRSVVAKVRWSF